MTEAEIQKRRARKRVLAAIVVAAALAFVLVLAAAMRAAAPRATSGAFGAELTAALSSADADLGAELAQTHECAACHLEGDGSSSPLFTRIADLAALRNPPLSAEEYLYEAILYPGAHLVDGYSNAMPNNYGDRLSQAEVGHLIAYLLTFSQAAADA